MRSATPHATGTRCAWCVLDRMKMVKFMVIIVNVILVHNRKAIVHKAAVEKQAAATSAELRNASRTTLEQLSCEMVVPFCLSHPNVTCPCNVSRPLQPQLR